MQTSAINSNTIALPAPDPTRVPVRTLNQDDFLKLLVAQLTTQDPMNPQTDTQFIAQMAQFSALEQSKSMQSDIAQLQANGMIGRMVELQDPDGSLFSGTVDAIRIDAGKPYIVVSGLTYELSAVRSIEQASNP